MKKFLTVSMMALAVVFASSCNKDENGNDGESGEATLVKSWVSEGLPAAYMLDLILPDMDGVPEEVLGELDGLLGDAKIRCVFDFREDKTGGVGVLVNKTELNVMIAGLTGVFTKYEGKYEALAEYKQILEKLAGVVKNYNDGDYIGAAYTYDVTPTDATSGAIDFVLKLDSRKDKKEACTYSGLAVDKVTLTEVEDEEDVEYPASGDEPVAGGDDDDDEPVVIPLSSASSANVKVGELRSVADIYDEIFAK